MPYFTLDYLSPSNSEAAIAFMVKEMHDKLTTKKLRSLTSLLQQIISNHLPCAALPLSFPFHVDIHSNSLFILQNVVLSIIKNTLKSSPQEDLQASLSEFTKFFYDSTLDLNFSLFHQPIPTFTDKDVYIEKPSEITTIVNSISKKRESSPCEYSINAKQARLNIAECPSSSRIDSLSNFTDLNTIKPSLVEDAGLQMINVYNAKLPTISLGEEILLELEKLDTLNPSITLPTNLPVICILQEKNRFTLNQKLIHNWGDYLEHLYEGAEFVLSSHIYLDTHDSILTSIATLHEHTLKTLLSLLKNQEYILPLITDIQHQADLSIKHYILIKNIQTSLKPTKSSLLDEILTSSPQSESIQTSLKPTKSSLLDKILTSSPQSESIQTSLEPTKSSLLEKILTSTPQSESILISSDSSNSITTLSSRETSPIVKKEKSQKSKKPTTSSLKISAFKKLPSFFIPMLYIKKNIYKNNITYFLSYIVSQHASLSKLKISNYNSLVTTINNAHSLMGKSNPRVFFKPYSNKKIPYTCLKTYMDVLEKLHKGLSLTSLYHQKYHPTILTRGSKVNLHLLLNNVLLLISQAANKIGLPLTPVTDLLFFDQIHQQVKQEIEEHARARQALITSTSKMSHTHIFPIFAITNSKFHSSNQSHDHLLPYTMSYSIIMHSKSAAHNYYDVRRAICTITNLITDLCAEPRLDFLIKYICPRTKKEQLLNRCEMLKIMLEGMEETLDIIHTEYPKLIKSTFNYNPIKSLNDAIKLIKSTLGGDIPVKQPPSILKKILQEYKDTPH
ncbi:hypothetical protein CLAVI_000937 [Candidatus Clavichlamydia salmonicola]|uniref:hypothetical protein n=1 Tax=Candidatus Clavichlamydia salmonicola TaxID=469812 RepID=UPI001891E61E|nr:hypothetical protein [Candidatus Clavichlamydia salmonicola]MBF5051296.1 hypothetical protein [Candidatus Clavichlamydia salmonicola]